MGKYIAEAEKDEEIDESLFLVTDADNADTTELKSKLKALYEKLKQRKKDLDEMPAKERKEEVKSIEALIKEETFKIFDAYKNKRHPGEFMKFMKAIEGSTWGNRMLGTYKAAYDCRKASIVAQTVARHEKKKHRES